MVRAIRSARPAIRFTMGIVAVLAGSTVAFGQDYDPAFWVTDGRVNAIARSANTVYIGGAFSNVGPSTGHAAPIDVNTCTLPATFPKVNGTVHAIIPDGNGGWYLGGQFASIGGFSRGNLAQVAADYSVTQWNPAADGQVKALARLGSTVLVGGNFTVVGGAPRARLAAVDAVTGIATSWNPTANQEVAAITVHTRQVVCPEGLCPVTTVYVGGNFTTIAGGARNYMVAFDANGALSEWDPLLNNRVYAISAVGATQVRVYVGGAFTRAGAVRNRVAAFDGAGALTSWNPNANNAVRTIAVSGANIYIGGDFTTIAGQSRNRLAAVDDTGALTGWDPNADAAAYTLISNGSTVFAGGDFTTAGGQVRNHIAALDPTTGAATAWDANASAPVRSLGLANSTLYVGGNFLSICRLQRHFLAALDATTGAATAWNPSPNGDVLALQVSGSTLYAAGCFTNVASQSRTHLAAFDTNAGSLTTWNPDAASNCIRALAAAGPTVYVGGDFTFIGGQPRSNLAALDAASATATSWNPDPDGMVRAIAVSGANVWVGGDFLNVSGEGHPYLAALDSSTGAAQVPGGTSAPVNTLAANGSLVYVGGAFTSVFGQARAYLAALDGATGVVTPWNAALDATVHAVAANGLRVYVGGDFSLHFRELSAATGAASTVDVTGQFWWGVDAAVYALEGAGAVVYAGGDFTTASFDLQPRLLSVNVPAVAACDAITQSASWGSCGTTVGTTSDYAGHVEAALDGTGGVFIMTNEGPAARLNRVQADGSIAPGWPPNGITVADSISYATVMSDGSGGCYVGWYSFFNSIVEARCTRYTAAGTLASGWPAAGVFTVPGFGFEQQLIPDGSGGVFAFDTAFLQHLDSTGAIVAGWPVGGQPVGASKAIADRAGGLFAFSGAQLKRLSHTGTVQWELSLPYSVLDLCADGSDGVFAVTGSGGSIRAHHVLGYGGPDPVWPSDGIVLTPSGTSAEATSDALGGVLVLWSEDGSVKKIVLQRLTAAGQVAEGWPAAGFRIGAASAQQQTVSAFSADGTGGAYLLWQARTGTGPRSWWGSRACPSGEVPSNWPADGVELCPNIGYSGGNSVLIADEAGGAFGSWYRRTATSGWAGSVHAMRLGSEPPSVFMVPVLPGSPSTVSIGNVEVTFDTVTAAGDLTLDLTMGPPPPAGVYTVPATGPAAYEIETTASFTGSVEVCVTYDPAQVSGSEGALELLHYEGEPGSPTWVNITTSVDANAHRICGRTTHFSPFLIAGSPTTSVMPPTAMLGLQQNRPNPFNPTTEIAYMLSEHGRVLLQVFDVRGRLIHTLVDAIKNPGFHLALWHGNDGKGRAVGSGVYLYRLDAAGHSLTRRMVLVR